MWKILKLINQKNKINWLDLLDIIEKESIKIAFFWSTISLSFR